MEGYISELYQFTLDCYKTQNPSIMFHASILNQVWSRIQQESSTMKMPWSPKIDEIIQQIIAVYLEANLTQEGSLRGGEEAEDEDENFERREKT